MSTALIRIASDIIPAIPAPAPLQPILTIVNEIVQRAKKLAEDRENLAQLALESHDLAQTLNSQSENSSVDFASPEVLCKIEELQIVLEAILKFYRRTEGLRSIVRFFKQSDLNSKITKLSKRLGTAKQSLQFVLSLDSNSKQRQQLILQSATYDAVQRFESLSVERRVSARSSLEVRDGLQEMGRHDFQVTTTAPLSIHEYHNGTNVVRVKAMHARLENGRSILIKRFEGDKKAGKARARKLYRKELMRNREILDGRVLQAMARSPSEEPSPYIIYHYSAPHQGNSFWSLWQELTKPKLIEDRSSASSMLIQLPNFLSEIKHFFYGDVPLWHDGQWNREFFEEWLRSINVVVEQSGGEGSSYNLVYTGELFHSTEEEGDEESEDGYRWGGWDNSEDKSEADEEELDDAYEQDWSSFALWICDTLSLDRDPWILEVLNRLTWHNPPRIQNPSDPSTDPVITILSRRLPKLSVTIPGQSTNQTIDLQSGKWLIVRYKGVGQIRKSSWDSELECWYDEIYDWNVQEKILSHVRGCSSLCEGEHGDQCSWKTKNFWLTWPEVDDE